MYLLWIFVGVILGILIMLKYEWDHGEQKENYVPGILYRLPSGQVLVITETAEWKKAVADRKSLYINFFLERHPDDVNQPFPSEHVVELRTHSYILEE